MDKAYQRVASRRSATATRWGLPFHPRKENCPRNADQRTGTHHDEKKIERVVHYEFHTLRKDELSHQI